MKGRIFFESCGTGRNWEEVNYLIGQNNKLHVYAEVEFPENASPDYGYKTMRKTLLEYLTFEEASDLIFDNDEWACAMDPDAETDCSVYLMITRAEEVVKGNDKIRTYTQKTILTKAED